MSDAIYTLTLDADETRMRARFIQEKLGEFNATFLGDVNHRPLTIVARDGAGEVVGGLLADIYWRTLSVNILWVDVRWRGRGLGAALMARAEAEARADGCMLAHVDTMEFQARGFYEKLGYTVFGELGPYNGQYSRYYLKKNLGG